MGFATTIAWRFQLKGTEQGRFSLMTLLVWLAVGIGIAAMTILLGVMYGFEASLRDKVLKAFPHLLIRPVSGSTLQIPNHRDLTARLKALSEAKTVIPYVEAEMILQSDRRTMGGVLWGVATEDFKNFKEGLQEGQLPDPQSRVPQVMVGAEPAERLGVGVGSRLKIVSPLERGGAMGMVPRAATFEVAGLYKSGHYEFDEGYLFLILEDAQDLMKWKDTISGWHLWANSLEKSEALQAAVAPLMPKSLEVVGWEVFNSALFQSLKLEQFAMFTILSFAIVIAVMNIVITLMMHVTNKRKNIGVLRALGASQRQIRRVFLVQGALLGGVGLVGGAVLTVLIMIYHRFFFSYQLPDIYYDRTIPIELRPLSVTLIYVVAVVLIVVASIYPSVKAAKLHPIDAIRE